MNAPKENFTDLARDLALCIANVLDRADCPVELRDPLNEAASQLIEMLAPSFSAQLRALAGLSEPGHITTRAEAETPVLGAQETALSESGAVSQALAASAIH